MESCRFNLKAEIFLKRPTKFSMDDLSHVARRVVETGLGAMTYADGEEFPLDFEADMDAEELKAYPVVLKTPQKINLWDFVERKFRGFISAF